MISHIDNLKEGAARRLLQNWAPALFTLLALVGAVGLPLQSLYSARTAHEVAIEDAARAADLRAELEAFRAADGGAVLADMQRATSELLPRDLSLIDVRATLQFLATTTGLEVEALSVGDPAPGRFATLDDSVGISEIALSGRGSPGHLSKVLLGMQSLGLPVGLRSFQLSRLAEDDPFEIHAALDLFQAIPPQVSEDIYDSEEPPMEDE